MVAIYEGNSSRSSVCSSGSEVSLDDPESFRRIGSVGDEDIQPVSERVNIDQKKLRELQR